MLCWLTAIFICICNRSVVHKSSQHFVLAGVWRQKRHAFPARNASHRWQQDPRSNATVSLLRRWTDYQNSTCESNSLSVGTLPQINFVTFCFKKRRRGPVWSPLHPLTHNTFKQKTGQEASGKYCAWQFEKPKRDRRYASFSEHIFCISGLTVLRSTGLYGSLEGQVNA